MVLFLTFPLGKGAKKEVLFCELGGGGGGLAEGPSCSLTYYYFFVLLLLPKYRFFV